MNFEHSQTYTEAGQATTVGSFQRIMRMFTISVLISFLGTLVGTQVPPALFMPLVVVELIMIIASVFIQRRGKPIGYPFVLSFVFISGITLYPAIAHYAYAGGGAIVMQAFILTIAIFGGLTAYAYYSKRDFSFLRGMLMVGLFVLIGAGIISLFTGGLGSMNMLFTILGVLIFSGFVLFDVSQYKHGVPEQFIPLAVLSMYLTFINLFLYLLRLLAALQSD